MKQALLIVAASLAATLLFAPSAGAIDDIGTNNLRKGVTSAGILDHMQAFQRRANANGGNRAAALPGYDASLAYVERRLERAGYETKRHAFDFAR